MRGEDLDLPCILCGECYPDFFIAEHEKRCDSTKPMRYFERERMAWIAEMLRIYGFIQREHLMRKFDISTPQASADFTVFQRLYPGAMEYNLSAKRYEANGGRHG